jgi:hypothetical protein
MQGRERIRNKESNEKSHLECGSIRAGSFCGVGLKQNNQPDGCGKRLKPYNRSFAAWR